MSREEIISSCGVFLIAGSETTATLLSGATYYLLTNPPVLKRLQAEVRESFQSDDEMTSYCAEDPSRLPYMEAVLTESLRMYPPVPAALPRITGSTGNVIDGLYVSANVNASIADSHIR